MSKLQAIPWKKDYLPGIKLSLDSSGNVIFHEWPVGAGAIPNEVTIATWVSEYQVALPELEKAQIEEQVFNGTGLAKWFKAYVLAVNDSTNPVASNADLTPAQIKAAVRLKF